MQFKHRRISIVQSVKPRKPIIWAVLPPSQMVFFKTKISLQKKNGKGWGVSQRGNFFHFYSFFSEDVPNHHGYHGHHEDHEHQYQDPHHGGLGGVCLPGVVECPQVTS